MIVDLKRPERFYTILLRPQWRSWLTIGSYILVVYGALSVSVSCRAVRGHRFAAFAAVARRASGRCSRRSIPGFLFAQAKGRDLWLSPALPVHFLVQALLAGAAILAIVGVVVASNPATRVLLHDMLLWSLLANRFII